MASVIEYQETPRLLINLVSPQFKEKILNLPDHLLNKSEQELIKTIQKEITEWIPSEIDFGLRMNFWDEYNWAQKNNSQMRMYTIYKGVCENPSFSAAANTPHRLAYIITPFFSETEKRRRALSVLWNEMLDIMVMKVPINSKTNTPDTKVLALKADLFKFLYAYEHGMPLQTQKITQETKNLNYNIEQTQSPPPDMATIDEQIKQLEARTLDTIPMEISPLLPTEKVISESGRIEDPKFKR